MSLRPRLAALRAAGSILLLVGPAPLPAQEWSLADAIRDALARHPAVEGARAAEDAASARVGGARAAFLPSLTASASAVRFEEPMVVAPLHGFDPTRPPTFDDALVRSQVALGYTLFDGGGRSAGLSAARSARAAATAGLASSEAQVIEATAQAWLGVVTAEAVLAASDRRRAALEAEVTRARRLFEAGSAPQVELLRAQAEAAQAEADHASAVAALAAARSILTRLTGRDIPDGLTAPRAASLPAEPSSLAAPPELAAARASADAADARARAARAAFLPRVAVASSIDQYGATGRRFTNEWQAGLQVSLPLFLGGARFAEARQRSAEARQAHADADRLALDLATARDRIASGVAEAEGRVNALESAEAQFTEVARVEALALTEGAGVQRDLLAAEAQLFRVRADLARARAALLTQRIALARADGRLDRAWVDAHLEGAR